MQLKKNPRDVQYQDLRDEPDDEHALDATDNRLGDRIGRNRPEFGDERSAEKRGESIIDAHSTFDGRFETEQDMRVMGTISGEVVCRGQFTVEHDATARCKVEAHDAIIRGHLEGDIVCSGRLLLANTAVVSGTFKSATLVVEEGANLAGNIETTVAPLARVTPVAGSRGSQPEPGSPAAARQEKDAPAPSSSPRNGRQTPSFAFVPSDDRTRSAER